MAHGTWPQRMPLHIFVIPPVRIPNVSYLDGKLLFDEDRESSIL